jgi:hypothetical protein
VHAFPNAKLDVNTTIPIQLSNMSTLALDVAWSYNVGDTPTNSTDSSAISAAGMNANVCVDMFLASDKNKSTSTTDAQFEVMVWLGRYGAATQPIGILQGARDTFTVNGTQLYVLPLLARGSLLTRPQQSVFRNQWFESRGSHLGCGKKYNPF